MSLILGLSLAACSGPEEKKEPAPKKVLRPKKEKITPAAVKLGLKSPKGSVRLSAMAKFEGLSESDRKALIPELWDVLQGKGLEVDKNKKSIVGQGRVNPLAALELDTDEELSKGKAASLLGELGDMKSYALLLEALFDDNFEFRNRVGFAFAKLIQRHPFAKRKLLEQFKTSPSYVRKEILEIFSLLKVEPEIRALFDRALKDPSVDVRVFALELSARRAPDSGVKLYIEAFLGPDRFLQTAAADQLVVLSKESSQDAKDRILEVLTAGLTTPHGFRPISAAKALSALGDPRALPALCKALGTRDKVTRRWANEAFISLVFEQKCALEMAEIDSLITQLSHKTRNVRINAATILGRCQFQKAKPGLKLMAANDKNEKARAAAKAALKQIVDPAKD
ncbi:MAG: hypothetical protein P1V97_09770 [Planctomycetota bacterium]|nr:hypothetical protein [Planctomycetota bacterium]